jgi:hypothetical protein
MIPEDNDPIVGHKTIAREDGIGYRHEPLRKSEADAILAHCDAEDARRQREMPDEQSAIRHMWDGWYRLSDFGWREIMYCPKDGSEFEVIEAGSTGIHRTHYVGTWPTGHCSGMSTPILWRPIASVDNGRIEG